MPLNFVDPDSTSPRLNVFLYGDPGTSKTTGALSAPGPILYLNAEGRNAAMFARRLRPEVEIREVAIEGGETLNEALLHLRGDNDVETVVLDSIGATYKAVLSAYAGGGKPTLPQYGDTTTSIERFALALRDLPVNIVLIAHAQSVKDEETGVLERLPYTGTKNPALGVNLMSEADVVGYTGVIEPDDDNAEFRYVAQLISAGGRRGKDRTGLLGKFPELDLTDWVDQYIQATAPVTPGSKPEKEAIAA